MNRPREHVPTRLRLSHDTLALIDETVAKARAEFDDPEIDRQRVLELLIEQRLDDLKRDGGMEETQFSLFKGRPIERRRNGLANTMSSTSTTSSSGTTTRPLGWR